MTPYVTLVIILFFCGLLEINYTGGNITASPSNTLARRKNIYAIIPVILLLYLGIFRETTVGVDGETYRVYYWLQLDRFSWSYLLSDFSGDNGFFVVLKVISLFTDDWWLARAILYTFTFSLYYVAIDEETPYPSVSILMCFGLGMITLMFGILRQVLAGAVTMLAYKQLKKNSRLKCLLLILLASTIHKTAFICIYMLVIHLLEHRKISGLKLIVLSLLSYAVFIAAVPMLSRLYADSRYETIAGSNGGYGMLLFMTVVVTFISYLMRITKAYSDKELINLFNLSCGALLVQIGALQWDLLTRASILFSIYWCILIPKLIYRLPKYRRLQCYITFFVLFGFMFFYQITDAETFVGHTF